MSEPALQMDAAYRHDALLYQGLQDFVHRTVSFIRNGIDAGEPVLVATTAAHIAALHSELGPDAGEVRFADMAEVGSNPARIIPYWMDFIAQAGGRPVRGIGEPIWAGRSPAELVECQRHESLLNAAIEMSTSMWLLCPYDTSALPRDVIEEARRSHPFVTEGATRRESGAYRPGLEPTAAGVASLPQPPAQRREFAFGPADLGSVRGIAAAGAAEAGMTAARTHDLVLAAHEVATNSVRHGGGGGVLRVWREDGSLICEFRDGGRLDDPLADRRRPEASVAGRRGLWVANQLCDLVQIRSEPTGTAVRIHMRT
ncbi:MAG TPA: anti-sigma factor RsbA family regulatory protein [Candidatus Dormibacteraeota bacterium]|nr:anti-sigma factor RsbA family regulatory protein [Candidatus Dormibacteraeota bacterium]